MGYCQGSAFIVGLLLMQVGGLGPAHPGSVCPQEVDKRRVFPPSGVLLGQNLPLCPPVTSDSHPPGLGGTFRLRSASVMFMGLGVSSRESSRLRRGRMEMAGNGPEDASTVGSGGGQTWGSSPSSTVSCQEALGR